MQSQRTYGSLSNGRLVEEAKEVHEVKQREVVLHNRSRSTVGVWLGCILPSLQQKVNPRAPTRRATLGPGDQSALRKAALEDRVYTGKAWQDTTKLRYSEGFVTAPPWGRPPNTPSVGL